MGMSVYFFTFCILLIVTSVIVFVNSRQQNRNGFGQKYFIFNKSCSKNLLTLGKCKFCNVRHALQLIRRDKINIFVQCQIWNNNSNEITTADSACSIYMNNIDIINEPKLMENNGLLRHDLNAKIGEFPHMAAIGYKITYKNIKKIEFSCGGSLISNRYVLTAAHCLFRSDAIDPTIVRLGKIDIEENLDRIVPQDYAIEKAIHFPAYRRSSHYHDVALLRLSKQVIFNRFVYPACLNTQNYVPNRQSFTVTGWGVHNILLFEQSRLLQKAQVNHINYIKCNKTFYRQTPHRIHNTRLHLGLNSSQHICALGTKLQDTCYGDSGGPLQVQKQRNHNLWTIVGVTSFGNGCGSKSPGIYVRVSTYVKWIESIVWNNHS